MWALKVPPTCLKKAPNPETQKLTFTRKCLLPASLHGIPCDRRLLPPRRSWLRPSSAAGIPEGSHTKGAAGSPEGALHTQKCAHKQTHGHEHRAFREKNRQRKKPLSSLCVKSPFIKASVAKELPLFQSPVSASLKIFPAQSRL